MTHRFPNDARSMHITSMHITSMHITSMHITSITSIHITSSLRGHGLSLQKFLLSYFPLAEEARNSWSGSDDKNPVNCDDNIFAPVVEGRREEDVANLEGQDARQRDEEDSFLRTLLPCWVVANECSLLKFLYPLESISYVRERGCKKVKTF